MKRIVPERISAAEATNGLRDKERVTVRVDADDEYWHSDNGPE